MSKLEIGIISPYAVFPPDFGGAVRIFEIVKYLGVSGCSVHLFIPENRGSFELGNVKVYPSGELNNVKKHYPIDIPGILALSKSLTRLIKRTKLYKMVDVIQSELLITAPHGLMLKKLTRKPAILDEHNVETMLWYQISKIKRQRWKKLRLLEMFACKNFDHILAVSAFHKRMTQAFFSIDPSKITVIPNGVDIHHFSQRNDDRERIRSKYGLKDKPVVLFIGRLSWFPNIDAVKLILLKIYPALKSFMPEVVFMVVGTNPPSWLISQKHKDFIVTGAVDDVAPYINAADVCVAPLRFGSGTRLKILEYMSCGKPVVSTSIGAEGLRVVNQKNIVLEDNMELFATQISYLLKNRSSAAVLGKEARELVESTYDWGIITRKLMKVYDYLGRS